MKVVGPLFLIVANFFNDVLESIGKVLGDPDVSLKDKRSDKSARMAHGKMQSASDATVIFGVSDG